jgi:hypothetical protein
VTQSKLQISVGNLSFSGEGEQAWLAEQLEKVLKAAPQAASSRQGAPNATATGEANSRGGEDFTATLASYIRDKGGDENQVDRFLITADWLRRRGIPKLTASEVTKALTVNQQRRLANAADSLNKNVSKGYCEKAEGGFYITPDGLKKLGYKQ